MASQLGRRREGATGGGSRRARWPNGGDDGRWEGRGREAKHGHEGGERKLTVQSVGGGGAPKRAGNERLGQRGEVDDASGLGW